MELSNRAQPSIKLLNSRVYPSYIRQNPQETNLYKWCRFPRERFLTQTMFARSPLEAQIKTLPLEIQQIIVTKVW